MVSSASSGSVTTSSASPATANSSRRPAAISRSIRGPHRPVVSGSAPGPAPEAPVASSRSRASRMPFSSARWSIRASASTPIAALSATFGARTRARAGARDQRGTLTTFTPRFSRGSRIISMICWLRPGCSSGSSQSHCSAILAWAPAPLQGAATVRGWYV